MTNSTTGDAGGEKFVPKLVDRWIGSARRALLAFAKYVNHESGAKFVLVGSVANDILFPGFSKIKPLDAEPHFNIAVIHPNPDVPFILPAVGQSDFALTHSYQQFGSYSLFFIRRPDQKLVESKQDTLLDYPKARVFIAEDDIETQEVRINDVLWNIPTKPEVLLKTMRDVFLFDAKHQYKKGGWQLPQKHRMLLQYLVDANGINALESWKDDLARLWSTEQGRIQRNYDFERNQKPDTGYNHFEPKISDIHQATFEQYVAVVLQILKEDDNFIPLESKQKLVGRVDTDGREEHAKQKPFGMQVIGSEEYVELMNRITELESTRA